MENRFGPSSRACARFLGRSVYTKSMSACPPLVIVPPNSPDARFIRAYGTRDVRLRTLTDFLVFFATVFIGTDIWGIDIGGLNIRFVQILFVLAALALLYNRQYRFGAPVWTFVFLGLGIVSSVFAVSMLRAFAFTFSIFYNIFFVFLVYYSYIRWRGGGRFLRIFRVSYFVQSGVLLFQFLLKIIFQFEFSFLPSYGEYLGVPRFQIWFYEPSFAATHFSLWFAFACYMLFLAKRKTYFFDFVVALFAFALLTSTSGFFALGLTIIVVYFWNLIRGFSWKKASLILVFGLGLLIFWLAFPSLFDVFIGRLFTGDMNKATGGRIGGMSETIQVFLENFWLGTGPGCYGLYLGLDAGVVPSNVTLELAANLGFLGPVLFYAITVYLVYLTYKTYQDAKEPRLIAFAFALVVFTIVLQVNQSYLRLYHWMAMGALYGLCHHYKEIYWIRFRQKALRYLELHPEVFNRPTDLKPTPNPLPAEEEA